MDGTLGVMSHCDAMKAGVVGRQRCKGTAVKWLNCIHIECSNDWEEMATSPDAARIMTSKGTIGYILVAADYHLKLLAYLVDNTEEYLCEAEVDDDEECVNNKNVLDVIITVR